MVRSKVWSFGCISILTTAILAIVIVAYSLGDPNPLGHFRDAAGERAYKEAYIAAMKLLPTPTRSLNLKTEYGIVRVYQFSRDTNLGVPVVLLPGRSSGAPMWASNLSDFAARRTVYMLDALGDAGYSVQQRSIQNSTDQARWLDQTLAQLGPLKFHIIGHSFGGWLAANYAVHFPQRLQTLSLLEPVFVFQGLRWQVYAETIPVALPFLPRSLRDRMLQDIGGGAPVDLNDPVARMISAATDHFSVKLPLPEQITDAQLRGLGMPVYVALGGRSFMHDSTKALRVAQHDVKNLHIKNWPEATHSLPMEIAQQLDQELLEFFATNDLHK
jgi:pimeloyl-ACP methyl ester carboxylesterase